ncbi:zinc-binding dehydrogenase [Nocardia cerradoensis]|uniref:zinc-binding dehydrogenase n=1 Tax=Nocardia cerradoensis TaxID=85688 RepID=UPI000B8AA459
MGAGGFGWIIEAAWVVLCGEVAVDRVGDVGESVELFRREHVGEAVANAPHIGRPGCLEGGPARIGQHDVVAAGIACTRRAPDRAARLHARDLTGEPAALPLQRLIEWVTTGRISAPQPHPLPLSEAADAHRRLESGTTTGKLVLEP